MAGVLSHASAELDAISTELNAIRRSEPHPLSPQPREVVEYVRRLQALERHMVTFLSHWGDDISYSERQALARKRDLANVLIRRQMLLAGRRAAHDRERSIITLNAIFKLGTEFDAPVQGRYRGDLVALCLWPPLGALGRSMARLWLPWLGKRFDRAAQAGDNIFTPGARIAGHLMWPVYSDYEPYRQGHVTAFRFHTYEGPGVHHPEIPTIKLDYSDPSNPSFLVRSVLDEITRISSNYYLGKAYLTNRHGDYRLAAFFALRRWVD